MQQPTTCHNQQHNQHSVGVGLHAQPGLTGHLTLTSIISYALCTTKYQHNYKTSNHATNHQHTRNNSVDVVISATYQVARSHCCIRSHYLIYHPTTPNHTSETPNSKLVSSPSHHNHSVALTSYLFFRDYAALNAALHWHKKKEITVTRSISCHFGGLMSGGLKSAHQFWSIVLSMRYRKFGIA